jgi:hypothetical protein
VEYTEKDLYELYLIKDIFYIAPYIRGNETDAPVRKYIQECRRKARRVIYNHRKNFDKQKLITIFNNKF